MLHTHMHTYTYTCTHTHIHTHACTRTHAHTLNIHIYGSHEHINFTCYCSLWPCHLLILLIPYKISVASVLPEDAGIVFIKSIIFTRIKCIIHVSFTNQCANCKFTLVTICNKTNFKAQGKGVIYLLHIQFYKFDENIFIISVLVTA